MPLPLLFLTSLLTAPPSPDASLPKRFEGEDACFILFDVTAGKELVRHGGAFCQERLPACSTFKVPLALMALDAGLFDDETAPFHWDGTQHEIESWNADQTAASWMKNSVVWVSQALTPRLGLAKIGRYLAGFRYGTQDMSGGLTTAWLNSPAIASLRLSPDEQLAFQRALWAGELPVSPRAVAVTKKLILLDTSPKGFVLHGKTGSGMVGPARDLRLGWFAGHVAKGGAEYLTVLAFRERRHDPARRGYPGPEAREATLELLKERGLW